MCSNRASFESWRLPARARTRSPDAGASRPQLLPPHRALTQGDGILRSSAVPNSPAEANSSAARLPWPGHTGAYGGGAEHLAAVRSIRQWILHSRTERMCDVQRNGPQREVRGCRPLPATVSSRHGTLATDDPATQLMTSLLESGG